ncbi:MAG TPA: LacI family DNA-binding transcriptional regulator [Ktedonosporobacter sp.]|nr:LacI family DNA-binding transcriptional regulator [Ktedonosporobacter sp.]
MPASLQDVAVKAGVSLATASRALNGKGGVKPETRQRVLAVAQELQFSATMAARGLATSRTETISYVVHQRHVPLDVDPFYPIIMHGVEAELSRQGYHLLLTTISDEQLKDASSFKPVSENRVDGVILAGPDISPRFILALRQLEVPVLLIDNTLDTVQVDAVYSDDVQGGRLATSHLIEHGHKTIAALLGPASWASSAHRGQGYRETMAASGLEPHIFHAGDTTLETGKALMQEALAALPALTAVFTANDAIAFGAMRVLAQQGRRVPQDVALIGFDDTRYSALSEPPLSTIKIFKHEMGKLAARRMLDMLTDDHGPAIQTVLATELVVRRSCGCTEL